MFHLVYFSSATKAFTKLELQKLLHEAREKNTKLGVTGMLLYKDGNFMQVLEGEQEVVTKLIGTIECDSRHKGVLVPVRGTSEERLFPDWSMGFRDLADPKCCQDAWLQRLHEYSAHGAPDSRGTRIAALSY
jgi:hypothetical protein